VSDLPRPRIEMEDTASPRLEFAAPDMPLVATPAGGVVPVLGGLAILVVGLGAIGVVDFVWDQLTRGPVAFGLSAAVAAIGFIVLLTGIARECRGLFALRTMDALGRALHDADLAVVKRAARRWLETLPEHVGMAAALDTLDDAEAVRALLRAGPVATLRARSDTCARNAALQTAAIIAAVPSAALDGLAVGWRGIRLVREIAVLHGLRPGMLATLLLLRRTALSAATVAMTELAVNTAAHALLSNPLLDRVLGDMAGAGVAARRMQVLGRAAAAACSPLSFRKM
jgi:putative membrane protein